MRVKYLVYVMSLLLLLACDGKFPTIIKTKYGEVKGFSDANNTLAWKGIQYAKPPVDELRWNAPEDPESWDEILDTSQYCNACPQIFTIPVIPPPEVEFGKEDCLYLNVWRPQSMNCNLPVYLWIHGGGNTNGTASNYNGSVIASRSNMVVVTIQYRLGPLGWLSHPALRHGEDPLVDSGNFGMLDIIKALEWVQENIRAFGGDPHNVLIAGESAGAHNVMNLMISPLAKGLFHKAIAQSYSMKTYTVSYGDEWTERVIDNLLADDGLNEVPRGDVEGYLRGKTAKELMLARYFDGKLQYSCAYEDGFVIPKGGVIPAIESGNYNKVPFIIGSNEDEMKLILPSTALLVKYAYLDPESGVEIPVPSSDYTYYDLERSLVSGSPLLDDVLPTDVDRKLYQACADYGSLNWRYNFVDSFARSLREQQDEIYGYLFKWDGVEGSDYDFVFGATHVTEIPFFFGADTDIWGGIAFDPENDAPGRQALSKAMMEYVANFARTGNPNGYGLPKWGKWSNKDGESKVIVFDATEKDVNIEMISEEITAEDVDAKFSYLYSLLPSEVRNLLYMFTWPNPRDMVG